MLSFSLSEYTKIDVGWGFAPDPTGELTALPRSLSWFQGGRFVTGGELRGAERRTRLGERDGRRKEEVGNSVLIVGG